ncbi:MAG TPA: hypothetical protein VE664_08360, partial [Actinomycetes bacterium]|nr:hypothetical protein [Actinomycetes bacterium]
MGSRRWLGLVGIALTMTLLAAACGGGGGGGGGGGSGAGTAQRGGVFRTALDDFGLSDGFDPTGEYNSIGFNSFHAILRTVMATKFTGGTEGNKLYPDLASAAPS